MNKQFQNRIKSLLWRAGVVSAIAFLSYIADNIIGLGLPNFWVVVIGLVCGEITKYLNTK